MGGGRGGGGKAGGRHHLGDGGAANIHAAGECGVGLDTFFVVAEAGDVGAPTLASCVVYLVLQPLQTKQRVDSSADHSLRPRWARRPEGVL